MTPLTYFSLMKEHGDMANAVSDFWDVFIVGAVISRILEARREIEVCVGASQTLPEA